MHEYHPAFEHSSEFRTAFPYVVYPYRGIEYYHVGRDPDADVLALVLRALEAGLESQLLVSHDLGWYDPAKPGGGTPRPYTHLVDWLLPALRAEGVEEAMITRLTHDNPFNAYAR